MCVVVEVVCAHGALVRGGDAWWWVTTAGPLRDRTGIVRGVVALPSCGETAEPASRGLMADAADLRVAPDHVEPVIVVGHSDASTVIAMPGHHPAGTVIAERGSHLAVKQLPYISSYLPHSGPPREDMIDGEPVSPHVKPGDGGLLALGGRVLVVRGVVPARRESSDPVRSLGSSDGSFHGGFHDPGLARRIARGGSRCIVC